MSERNLPTIAKERIDYHPALQERYGIDRSSWRALVEAVFPSAKTIEGVILALSYCKSRNLDVFKRPVHVVPIWNTDLRRYVETVWPGIGELRTTAFRTGDYIGCDEATFGPEVQRTFTSENSNVTVTFPAWAQVTVRRMVRGKETTFAGPKVRWLETYATEGRTEVPNAMWRKRPYGQLEKCAEAAALRKAFPEEVGEDQIPEEAQGLVDVTPDRGEEQKPSQPLAAPTYVAVYSAHGEEFSLLPGEVEQWIIGQTDGATADELEALRDNNEHPGVVAGAKAALRELRQPKEERSGPPTERAKSRGRPKKADAIAREILAEIAATEPGMGADTLAAHQDQLNAWAADPETHHLVNELVNAVQDHDAPADEAEANDAPEPDPMDAEGKPPVGETTGAVDDGDAYSKWVMEVRKQAMGLPSVAHVGPQSGYRRGRLAEAGQWDDPEGAEREVHAAFDAQLRKLSGGGR